MWSVIIVHYCAHNVQPAEAKLLYSNKFQSSSVMSIVKIRGELITGLDETYYRENMRGSKSGHIFYIYVYDVYSNVIRVLFLDLAL